MNKVIVLAIGIILMMGIVSVAGATDVWMEIGISNGTATIVQTAGNRTLSLEIETNETVRIETFADNNTLNYSVRGNGSGTVEINGAGEEYFVETEVDEEPAESYQGAGVFSQVVRFFKSVFLWGWLR